MGLPKIAELQQKCVDLGYPWDQVASLGKAGCVSLLRKAHLPEGGLPYMELTPMLCFPMWKMHQWEQDAIWDNHSNMWVAQEKLNGVRVICHFVAGKGIYLHTRTTSVRTWRYQEVTEQFLLAEWIPDFSCTLDCEAIIDCPIDSGRKTGNTKSTLASTVTALHLEATESRRLQREQGAPLRLQVFDITQWGEIDLREDPLWIRLENLGMLIEVLGKTPIRDYFLFSEVIEEDFRGAMQRVVRAGGEGLIFKHLNSNYIDSSSRKRDGWVKTKRRMEFDAFVSGFKPGEPGTEWEGMVGSLEFSVYLTDNLSDPENPNKHIIGYASAMPMELREKVSERTELGLFLNKDYMGRVAQISGQDISARQLRLTHCTIDRWRDSGVDCKDSMECVESLGDLERMAKWVK